jgi:hypothetical protein
LKTSRKQESSITKKAKTPRDRAQETKAVSRFDILVEESRKLCEAVGLHKDLILEIAKTDSDWAFILKIDALLETASNGRTSILKLLEAAGCPQKNRVLSKLLVR